MKSENEHIERLVGGVVGTRDYIEWYLLNKGLSQLTVDIVISKVESIIAASGELGRLLQHEKDFIELRKMHIELDKVKKRGGCIG